MAVFVMFFTPFWTNPHDAVDKAPWLKLLTALLGVRTEAAATVEGCGGGIMGCEVFFC